MSLQANIEIITNGPFAVNSYIVSDPATSACAIVDPGAEPERLVNFITTKKLNPVALLNTHGHVDHIEGNGVIKNTYNIPLYIGVHDAEMLTNTTLNLSAWLPHGIVSPPADKQLNEGDTIEVGKLNFKTLHTPGHTPGHVTFVVENHCLCGDVLFAGSIGRTDFPGGSMDTLLASIKEKLMVLPDAYQVYSGHGPVTTIGREKKENPFVNEHL